jgi:hypothetical protein
VSYGTSIADTFRQIGVYTGRILKGANPADLPFVQSTKFEFVINLQTAQALGIEVASGPLATTNELIDELRIGPDGPWSAQLFATLASPRKSGLRQSNSTAVGQSCQSTWCGARPPFRCEKSALDPC